MSGITDAELIRWLINTVGSILLGVGFVGWWAVRVIVRNIGELRNAFDSEARFQDVRTTRIETHLDLPPLQRHDRVA